MCGETHRGFESLTLRRDMKIYKKYFLPRFLNKEMGSSDFNESRAEVAGRASGVVLEIGFGSGYNLPFYKNVKKLYALEPSREMYRYSEQRVQHAPFPIEHLAAGAEQIPLPDESVDSVVSTWALCSVSDISEALAEVRRVLKQGGVFSFVEHGLSPKPVSSFIQRIVTPVSKHFTGNCHLDRDISGHVSQAGFTFAELEKSPEAGRPLMFSYRGVAVKKP